MFDAPATFGVVFKLDNQVYSNVQLGSSPSHQLLKHQLRTCFNW